MAACINAALQNSPAKKQLIYHIQTKGGKKQLIYHIQTKGGKKQLIYHIQTKGGKKQLIYHIQTKGGCEKELQIIHAAFDGVGSESNTKIEKFILFHALLIKHTTR